MKKRSSCWVIFCCVSLLFTGCAMFGATGGPETEKLLNVEGDRPDAVVMVTRDISYQLAEAEAKLATIEVSSEDAVAEQVSLAKDNLAAATANLRSIDTHQKEAKASLSAIKGSYEVKDDGLDHSLELYGNPTFAAPQRAVVEKITAERGDITESWWWQGGVILLETLGVGGLGVVATKTAKRIKKGFKYESTQEALNEVQEVFGHVSTAIDKVAPEANAAVKEKIKELTNLADRFKIDNLLKETREKTAAQEVAKKNNAPKA